MEGDRFLCWYEDKLYSIIFSEVSVLFYNISISILFMFLIRKINIYFNCWRYDIINCLNYWNNSEAIWFIIILIHYYFARYSSQLVWITQNSNTRLSYHQFHYIFFLKHVIKSFNGHFRRKHVRSVRHSIKIDEYHLPDVNSVDITIPWISQFCSYRCNFPRLFIFIWIFQDKIFLFAFSLCVL